MEAIRLDELSGADRRGMADDGDQIRSRWPRAFTRRIQNPLSSPKEGHALDKAGEIGMEGAAA